MTHNSCTSRCYYPSCRLLATNICINCNVGYCDMCKMFSESESELYNLYHETQSTDHYQCPYCFIAFLQEIILESY